MPFFEFVFDEECFLGGGITPKDEVCAFIDSAAEVVVLVWKDIRFETEGLTVMGKGGDEREGGFCHSGDDRRRNLRGYFYRHFVRAISFSVHGSRVGLVPPVPSSLPPSPVWLPVS